MAAFEVIGAATSAGGGDSSMLGLVDAVEQALNNSDATPSARILCRPDLIMSGYGTTLLTQKVVGQ